MGPVPNHLLRALVHDLARAFGVSVTLGAELGLVGIRKLDDVRFDSNALLDLLIAVRPGNDTITLGVLDGDVAVPGLAFAFGQATVGGCCALVALARLRPGPSSSVGAADLLRRRVLTESVHEVGHVLGLAHCAARSCALFRSRNVEDTDAKGPVLCAACSLAIAGFDANPTPALHFQ